MTSGIDLLPFMFPCLVLAMLGGIGFILGILVGGIRINIKWTNKDD